MYLLETLPDSIINIIKLYVIFIPKTNEELKSAVDLLKMFIIYIVSPQIRQTKNLFTIE